LQALTADCCARLRDLDHQAEREFLIDLKRFVLDRATHPLGAFGEESDASLPTIDTLQKLVQSLPLVHQEIVLLKLAGYPAATLEKILFVPASLIQAAIAPVANALALSADRGTESRPVPNAWLDVLREVRAARKPDCPSHRLFVRILDGQISWYEKTPVEEHMAKCLPCLDYWTSLREIDYLRRDTSPLPPREVDALISSLPSGLLAAESRSWLARWFRR
jgi:hypothetical protein